MTKIKTITKKDNTFNGKTTTSYTFLLDDGTTGYVDGKSATTFREGDDVQCAVEVKQNKKGGNYNLLTLTPSQSQQPANLSKPSAPQGTPSSLKAQTRARVPFTAMEKVIDLVIASKVPWEKVGEYHKELCTVLYGEIESCFAE